ncbi:MAG: hypothetical protein LBQ22_00720 [Bacteroidales bacterium]|jgi:hypothetical protein|nr:hypothetical protein [Bacteroidales bacterium]
MYSVIINANCTKISGALTILKDCIAYLESFPQNNDTKYHLITVLDNFDVLKKIMFIN